jgi:ectoine hydroxylase-related dioxygenase (phytanoyl-CoA dioxygenase family)
MTAMPGRYAGAAGAGNRFSGRPDAPVMRGNAAARAGIYRGAVTGPLITQELADAFASDGMVCVRRALDPGEVADAVRAIDAVLASPGPLAQVASGADDPGSFTEDFRRWREIGEIEKLARNSRLPQLAAELMSTPQVRFYHDHVLVKEGGTRQRTPWHQDQPYYNVDGPGVSAWIPVDPVPEAGCLELVAGTHRGPWLMPRTFLAGEANWFPEGSLAELPDIEAGREAFDIRRFDLQPGDAILFDFLTVHGAPGFPYPGRRRVLSLRYLSAAARHAPRGWRTSPPFDGVDAELPSGAVMDHPLFPVVWPPSA